MIKQFQINRLFNPYIPGKSQTKDMPDEIKQNGISKNPNLPWLHSIQLAFIRIWKYADFFEIKLITAWRRGEI